MGERRRRMLVTAAIAVAWITVSLFFLAVCAAAKRGERF
jgi:hypothetical protein